MTNINLPSLDKVIKASIIVILLAIFSYYFIDRPVATWTFYNSRVHPWHALWQQPTHLEVFYYFLSPWIMVYLITKSVRQAKQTKQTKQTKQIIQINNANIILFLMVMSLWLSYFVSEEMRILFGRSWAATWFHGNLSYIQDGVYGFKWFQTAHEYKSFPSGHTTLTFAFMMALWWQVSDIRLKIFAILNCFLVGMGLILMCYHWVSDVIIGALVGSISAYTILSGYKYQCLKEYDVKK